MTFSPDASDVYRTHVTKFVPSSGVNQPDLAEIRALLAQYEAVMNGFTTAGGLIFATKTLMDAQAATYSEPRSAWVYADSTPANNGVYVLNPTTDTWTKVGRLPYDFVIGTDTGAGTANAIQITTDIPVADGMIVAFSLFEATTSSPVTVAINGGAALTLKTNRGADASALTADMEIWGRVRSSDNTLRLLNDQDVSALVAQAEAVLEEFQTQYLGQFATNPTTDVNGNPVIEGAFYWNTVSKVYRYWDGDSWETFPNATAAPGSITNDKLADVPTDTFKGRVAAGTGAPTDLTAEQVRDAIDPALDDTVGFVSDGWLNVAVNTTNKQIMSRTAHVAKTALSSLQVIFANWWVDPSSYAEVGIGGSATITASIEYPIGVFTQAKFSTATSAVVADGDQVTTDSVSVNIPEGATFWIRSFYANTAGIIFRGQLDQTNFGYAEYAASGVTDKTMGGAIVSSGASAYMPLAIIGQTDKPSVALIGDSRTAGTGDTMDETVFVGNLHRSIGEYAGCCVLARGGDRADKFVASHAKRLALVNSYADAVVIATGINDLTAGRSAAQLQADVETMIGYFPTKRVFACTIEPVSDSTDGYVTIANQTPRAAANNTGRNTFNAAVRAGLSGATGYFELADAVEYNRIGVWKVTYGTPHTADGAHATKYGYELQRDSGVVNQFRIEKSLLRRRLASVGAARRGRAHDGLMTPFLVRQAIRHMSDIGEWTPISEGVTSAGAGTYSVQSGTYRLFGDICFIHFDVFWTAHTGTGNLVIKGLPFIPSKVSPIDIVAGSLTFSGQLAAYASTLNRIDLWSQATGASLAAVPMDTSARIWGNGWYFIDVYNASRTP